MIGYVVRINDCLARDVASRYDRNGFDAERVLAAARLGLIRAAEEYDPASGEDFVGYAVSIIRSATEDQLSTWAIPDATGWTPGT
jgi:DNA-directed RNA polymerase specialized sigma subunit